VGCFGIFKVPGYRLRAGQVAEGRSFLDKYKPDLSPADYARLDAVFIDTELLGLANRIRDAADGDKAIAAIDEARLGGRIANSRATELLTFAVQKTATALSAARSTEGRDWLAAINYIENAVARFGSNREWEQALQTYRNNRAADFHNRFAAAWNRRNFDEARSILDEGLAEFPDNRQLLANRETVNRHQGQSGSR
jgi:tetratricopeptide (TPR) repeat protein